MAKEFDISGDSEFVRLVEKGCQRRLPSDAWQISGFWGKKLIVEDNYATEAAGIIRDAESKVENFNRQQQTKQKAEQKLAQNPNPGHGNKIAGLEG